LTKIIISLVKIILINQNLYYLLYLILILCDLDKLFIYLFVIFLFLLAVSVLFWVTLQSQIDHHVHIAVSEAKQVVENYKGTEREGLIKNLVSAQGMTVVVLSPDGSPILFPEWAYLGKGRFQRRDFRFDALTQMSLFGEGTIFESLESHEIFVPEKDYPPLTISGIAGLEISDG